jgi:tungstate transport system substrate-binding protein
VIPLNPQKWPKVNAAGAKAFADYLVSAEGQDLISKYGVDKYGQALFIPDANKTDADIGLQ